MTKPSKTAYLNAMGIDVWQSRDLDSTNHALVTSDTSAVASMDWQQLASAVSTCQACGLCQGRTQTVFGVGNQQADIMIIGEAPGHYEDLAGEPFVGRAGQLLNAMLAAINLKREQVFIANILKCRPPNNRDPSPEETATCTPFLQRQIQLIKPKIMLALGRIAAHHLLGNDLPMSHLRGKSQEYPPLNIPLIVTYHPAYLLRTPTAKAKTWQDLQLLVQLLNNAN